MHALTSSRTNQTVAFKKKINDKTFEVAELFVDYLNGPISAYHTISLISVE